MFMDTVTYHGEDYQIEWYDRDSSYGFKVIRKSDKEVFNNLVGVFKRRFPIVVAQLRKAN